MLASNISVSLFVAAVASAGLVPRRNPPSGWWTAGLEDYQVYHTRYLALGCEYYHGQSFFDECCHPLKKDETLEAARPPQCIPSASASASAVSAEPTSTVTTPDDEPQSSSTSSANLAVSSSTAGDDDGDEDCEDGNDDESSTVLASTPTSTKVSSSTVAATTHASSTHTSTSASSAFTPTSTPTSTAHIFTPTSSSLSSIHSSSSRTSSTKTSTASSSASTSDVSGEVVSGGFATFFYQNGNKGACGDAHSDSDLIGAIDYRRYGDTGEVSALCGKQVKITNTDNNKSVTITIADACPSCQNKNCIDLSTGAFDKIADEATGEVPIAWEFI